MGNPKDYEFYQRPVDGKEQPSVQIVDDGSGPGPAAGDAGVAGGASGAGGHGFGEAVPPTDVPPAPGGEAAGGNSGGPVPRQVNFSLAGAWILVGLLLAVGLAWLTGTLPAPQLMYYDPSGSEPGETLGVTATNLYSIGPFLFLFGILGAFTLLAVQGAQFRRRA